MRKYYAKLFWLHGESVCVSFSDRRCRFFGPSAATKRACPYTKHLSVCISREGLHLYIPKAYVRHSSKKKEKKAFFDVTTKFFAFLQLSTSSFFPSFVSHFPPNGKMCTDYWTISPYFGIKRAGEVFSGSDISRHQHNNTKKSKDERFT